MMEKMMLVPPLLNTRDFVALLCVALILSGLGLPLIRSCRDDSQQAECSNRLKTVAKGLLEYESTFRFLPNCMGGTSTGTELTCNLGRLSGFVALIPYIEKSDLFDRISTGDEKFPPMGPAPWVEQYNPWVSLFSRSNLICPSAPKLPFKISPKNYAFCIGDLARSIHKPVHPRGVFAPGYNTKLSDIKDGLSWTMAICEIGSRDGRIFAGQCAIEQPVEWLELPANAQNIGTGNRYDESVKLTELGRGGNWVDGAALFGLVNTILGPNSLSVSFGAEATSDGFYSAGSFHVGGVHVSMADGAVRFISHNLDLGDRKSPVPFVTDDSNQPPSPYGAWGSLGTANGGEVIPDPNE